MLITTYDYWGYYNICYLAGEVEKPERNVPRAVLISIVLVAAIYLLMNISVLGVIPWQQLAGQTERGRALFGDFRFHAADLWRMGGQSRHRADHLDGVRLGFLAAAGLFARAVCRGAGRQLFRGLRQAAPEVPLSPRFAAGDGRGGHGLLRVAACRRDRRAGGDSPDSLQFLLQEVGLMILRKRHPEMPRPFRMWLYPLPALLATAGFVYILISRPNFLREIRYAVVLLIAGLVALFCARRASPRMALEASSKKPCRNDQTIEQRQMRRRDRPADACGDYV